MSIKKLVEEIFSEASYSPAEQATLKKLAGYFSIPQAKLLSDPEARKFLDYYIKPGPTMGDFAGSAHRWAKDLPNLFGTADNSLWAHYDRGTK